MNAVRLTLLTLCSALGGLWLRAQYGGTWLEYAGFVTGIICIYLVAQESIWNWPIGIINASIYAVFFFQGKFPADAGLQIFFLFLGILGWWTWLRGGEGKTELDISRLSKQNWLQLLAVWAIGTACLFPVARGLEGKWPFWDSFLTVGSVLAQILVNKKKLENWLLWIVVNTCYVPIFFYRQWYMSAVLYFIFWCLAIAGFINWKRTLTGHQRIENV